MPLIERCLCDGRLFRAVEGYGLPLRECRDCYIVHQSVSMDAEAYADWYRSNYHNGVYTHSYEHDRAVAEARVAKYGRRLKGAVLDVGCGSRAFVDACNDHDITAVGQDIAAGDSPIEEMNGRYGTITMHDVLEHAVDPSAMLDAARRLLEPGGFLIIDFPAFFKEGGARHWKLTEHLWMLTERQLDRVLEDAGFDVVDTEIPVPGKFTKYCR